MPFFVVFQASTGRWVVRGPFPSPAAAAAGQPQDTDPQQPTPRQIVEAAHGMAAALIVFRALHVPGYHRQPGA
jgi:hypothetical protein